MKKLAIIGNPNTGKSTLFNSLTRSDIKTGNWHGVTVDSSAKTVGFGTEKVEVIDLPGIYSMQAFSFEEQVTIDYITKNAGSTDFLIVLDANSMRRNLYLALQLAEMGLHYVVYINNYDLFVKSGGKIDITKLAEALNCRIIIGNANIQKISKNLFADRYSTIVASLDDEQKRINRYRRINSIYHQCVSMKRGFIYGDNKLDKILMNKWLYLPIFLLLMFGIMYITFFLVGPKLSDGLISIIQNIVISPFLSLLKSVNAADWVTMLFSDGIFASIISVLTFIFPIIILNIFLGMIEDSGYMSRLAFNLDDSMHRVGLSGKSVYTLMLGFGCNTTAMYTAKGMPNANLRTKTALLTQYMSCSAKLPIYSVVAGAIFGVKSVLVIFGLYILGIVLALILSYVLEKTKLPSADDRFLIEFPSIRRPSIKKILRSAWRSSKQFLQKVFLIIVSVSIIVWVLNNFNYRFEFIPYGDNNILPSFTRLIAPIFAPIGLNNSHIVTALLIGVVAKELILSSIAMSNSVSGNANIMASLAVAGSAITFSPASAISFLIMCLLYTPCLSSTAVLFNEVGRKYTWFALVSQFVIAYSLSFIAYHMLSGTFGIAEIVALIIIGLALIVTIAVFKRKKTCKNCVGCAYPCSRKKM